MRVFIINSRKHQRVRRGGVNHLVQAELLVGQVPEIRPKQELETAVGGKAPNGVVCN